jgi:leukotriene-A4 hydrolase
MYLGRMKFCRPIFRSVGRVDNKLAKEVFGKSKDAFHPIARRLIEKVRTRWGSLHVIY